MKQEATLTLIKNGEKVKRFSFRKGGILLIGRKGFGANIEIDSKLVSRIHARLDFTSDTIIIIDEGSSNKSFINGKTISAQVGHPVSDKDILSFGRNSGYSIKVNYKNTDGNGVEQERARNVTPHDLYNFDEANIFQLLDTYGEVWVSRKNYGQQVLMDKMNISKIREKANVSGTKMAVVEIDDSIVSRKEQTFFFKKSDRYFLMDLGSANGTYLNDTRLYDKDIREIKKKDKVLIAGLYLIEPEGAVHNLGKELALKATKITKVYSFRKLSNGLMKKRKTALHEMSIGIERGKFVALMGPSGCGKSTLLKALNFASPASSGKVYVHGLDLEADFEFLKRRIGYVPQDDIIHRELTVRQSLYYAAKLRMGDHVKEEEIRKKINEVTGTLQIQDKLNDKVSELSGGQRKRVSIAVELLNNPSVLFLDEPTSPLDPETIKVFLECIRKLTKQGTTVIMVTHKPEDLKYVDEVIFLTTKGYLAFYGKQDEVFSYFGTQDIIEIYSLLSRQENAKDFFKKWRSRKQKSSDSGNLGNLTSKKESLLQQFYWLSRRYLNIKLSNTTNMLILIAQPIIIAGLLVLIFDQIQLGTLFLMAVAAIWFGVSNAAKEIVGEIPIYNRERMYNLDIIVYLLSKLFVLSIIALAQVSIFVMIVYFKYEGQDIHIVDWPTYLSFMFYLSFSATLLGLFLSSTAVNTEVVMTVVPIALMPQIMLAGVINRIDNIGKELLSYLTLGRWGTEGFANIQDDYADYNYMAELFRLEKNEQALPPVIDTIRVDDEYAQYGSIYNPILEVSDSLLIKKPDGEFVPYMTGELDHGNTAGAIETLGFYNGDNTLLNICEQAGLLGNIYMITLLNVIVFGSIYLAMKAKDNL